jgi:hypothetical protein
MQSLLIFNQKLFSYFFLLFKYVRKGTVGDEPLQLEHTDEQKTDRYNSTAFVVGLGGGGT